MKNMSEENVQDYIRGLHIIGTRTAQELVTRAQVMLNFSKRSSQIEPQQPI
jgi:hypothetical protein